MRALSRTEQRRGIRWAKLIGRNWLHVAVGEENGLTSIFVFSSSPVLVSDVDVCALAEGMGKRAGVNAATKKENGKPQCLCTTGCNNNRGFSSVATCLKVQALGLGAHMLVHTVLRTYILRAPYSVLRQCIWLSGCKQYARPYCLELAEGRPLLLVTPLLAGPQSCLILLRAARASVPIGTHLDVGGCRGATLQCFKVLKSRLQCRRVVAQSRRRHL